MTAMPGRNHDLKEDIRAYWRRRAATLDTGHGHRIAGAAELDAWVALVRALAPDLPPGPRALELAQGTGEATRILLALGATVDAVELAEPMIARARAKHAGQPVRTLHGDAEHLLVEPAAYDLVFARNLAWTLTDPPAAYRGWLAVLKPGGRLVLVDGDWARRDPINRAALRAMALLDRWQGRAPLHDAVAHAAIMAALPYGGGLTAARLAADLAAAGFTDIGPGDLGPLRRTQWRGLGPRDRLAWLAIAGRGFAVSARRPVAGTGPSG